MPSRLYLSEIDLRMAYRKCWNRIPSSIHISLRWITFCCWLSHVLRAYSAWSLNRHIRFASIDGSRASVRLHSRLFVLNVKSPNLWARWRISAALFGSSTFWTSEPSWPGSGGKGDLPKVSLLSLALCLLGNSGLLSTASSPHTSKNKFDSDLRGFFGFILGSTSSWIEFAFSYCKLRLEFYFCSSCNSRNLFDIFNYIL